jgi:hypothetical protein
LNREVWSRFRVGTFLPFHHFDWNSPEIVWPLGGLKLDWNYSLFVLKTRPISVRHA